MKKYTSVCKFEDGYHVYLSVGHQSFCVTPFPYKTSEEAEWMREQLANAITTLVKNEKEAAIINLYNHGSV